MARVIPERSGGDGTSVQYTGTRHGHHPFRTGSVYVLQSSKRQADSSLQDITEIVLFLLRVKDLSLFVFVQPCALVFNQYVNNIPLAAIGTSQVFRQGPCCQ